MYIFSSGGHQLTTEQLDKLPLFPYLKSFRVCHMDSVNFKLICSFISVSYVLSYYIIKKLFLE